MNHILPKGTMPRASLNRASMAKAERVTSMKFLGGAVTSRHPNANTMDYFRVYGVNANPMKAGTTAGHEGRVISRRNITRAG